MGIRQRWQTMRRRMRADGQKGSTAIEFAFVAPVFFVLLMGIIEGGMMFFGQSVLQNAVTEMSRQIRTGQAQSGSMTQAQFRTGVCTLIAPLLACNANLQIDVQSYAGYNSISENSPLLANQTLDPALTHYMTGNACDVVLVRAYYAMPIATPVLNWFLVNMANNSHLLAAAAAFRNEPFNAGVGGC